MDEIREERWEKVSEKLEKADEKMEESLDGSEEHEKEPNNLTYAWVLNLHEAYENVRDELIDVAFYGKDPEHALQNSSVIIQRDVLKGFDVVKDHIEEHNNFAEIFSIKGYESVEEALPNIDALPDDLYEISGEDVRRNFHPTLEDLKEDYQKLIELYESERENRTDWNRLSQQS